MARRAHRNIERLVAVAHRLGDLADEMVFVGGAATGLLITDPAAPDVRPTLDIDVIVEVASRAEYYRLQERLRGKGFSESMEDGILCRWRHGDLILDVMPTDERILGFTNRWYVDAIRFAQELDVDDTHLKIVTGPYFLGTKLEAFRGRGQGDYMTSRDMEDIVTVLDGRSEIVDEVAHAQAGIREYLAQEFRALLSDTDFIDALPGHLPPDSVSQKRTLIVEERIRKITKLR